MAKIVNSSIDIQSYLPPKKSEKLDINGGGGLNDAGLVEILEPLLGLTIFLDELITARGNSSISSEYISKASIQIDC